jgi:hypothetical protein
METVEFSCDLSQQGAVGLGDPEYLEAATLEQLDEASRLRREVCPWTWRGGRIGLELPPHAIAALTVELGPV